MEEIKITQQTLEQLKTLSRRMMAMMAKKEPLEQITVPVQNMRLLCQVVINTQDLEQAKPGEHLLPIGIKQQAVLKEVQRFIDKHAISPSYRQISDAIGYKSHNASKHMVDELIEKGYLKRTPSDGMLKVLVRHEDIKNKQKES